MQIILEQAGYQLVKHDGGSYQIKYKGSTELLTFDENMAINHFFKCIENYKQKGDEKLGSIR